jgi:YVTN family beta-propeller protein
MARVWSLLCVVIAAAAFAQGFPDSVVAEIPVGGDPTDIAVLPNGRFAYIGNQAVQYVTVVDVQNRSVVTRVTCGTNPYMLAPKPDGQYVYAANERNDNVSVIRTSDNTVVATVPVGATPHRLCFSPDGSRCYVTNMDGNTVSVIRTSDNTVVATVPVGSNPHDVDCTTDGQYVYAANTDASTLTKIRTSDNTVVRTVNLSFGPHRVRAIPGAGYVYATEHLGTRIAVVRTSDDSVISTLNTGVSVGGMCYVSDGDYLFVGSDYSGGAALVIRTSDNTIVARIVTGGLAVSVHAPADGAYVASSNRDVRSVTVIGYRHQHDVCPTSILAPGGILDSGTAVEPTVLVKNQGVAAAIFPVTMQIGSGYSDTMQDTLPAGSSDTVRFPLWTAGPVGTSRVVCFTELAGDENPANDTITDSVLVNRVDITDVGTTAILAPSGTVDSGTVVTPAAVVRNFGTAVAVCPVTMTIDGFYTRTVTESLPAGTADTVSFPAWTAGPVGAFAVACHTTLVGDRNPANDTVTDSVRVRRVLNLDVGPIEILSPLGTVDSGVQLTPEVVMRNLGTSSATFPTTLLIGSGYSQTLPDTLAAGATDTLRFPVWTAGPVGTSPVVCFTGLTGDENPSNDTIRDSVRVRRVLNLDVGPIEILSPPGTSESGSVYMPTAVVRNFGLTSAVFPVTMTIGSVYVRTAQETLASGLADTVVFPAWVAEPVGQVAIACFTALAGDGDPTNDTIRDSVRVVGQRVHDVSAIAIAEPLGTVHTGDTVIPRARIKNFGNTAEQFFDARFRIGASYSRTVNVASALPPGSTVELTFPPWVAAPGDWAVSCSTMLAGDVNRANDKVSSSVRVFAQALQIEPDQSDRLEVGEGKTYRFYALIDGDTGGVVEVVRPTAPTGWSARLRDATGTNDLTDSDGDGIPDLGYVTPGETSQFSLEVMTPTGLVGDTALLTQKSFVIAGHLGNDSLVADTALLNLALVPAFSVHNFPNPFSDRTTFVIGLPTDGKASLTVYTRAGERICRVMNNSDMPAGVHLVSWDGVNDNGRSIAPGTYEYLLDYVHAGKTDRIRKRLVLTRQ